MNEFRLKGHISDEDFMIHFLNNLSKEYDLIFNGLENYLMVSGDNVLTIDVICKKLNYWYKKLKTKMNKKLKGKGLRNLQQTIQATVQ